MIGPPRYTYTVHETKLIVDGEEVTVSGLLECARDLLGFPTDKPGRYHMLGGTTAAATRLKNGGAVLTMFPSACSAGPGRDANAMYYPGFYPAIYLVDNATKPSRIDYYFSDVSLHDPTSRVRLVDFQARQSWSPIRSYHLLARYRWGNLSSAVPGLMDDPAMYVGYTMTVLPFSELTDDERKFVDDQDNLDEIARISVNRNTSPAAAADLLRETKGGPVGPSTSSACQFEVRQSCRVLRRTFGIPVVDDVPTLRGLDGLTAYVELARRADLSGADDHGRRRLDSIEDTTQFRLFGRIEKVNRGELWRVFVPPHESIVFGLGVELLSRDRILKQ